MLKHCFHYFFFPPSLQCNLPGRYGANTGCSLLTTCEIYRGWLLNGMMSWIKAERSCMYFERSRVPFSQSRVTPFGGNPDLISQSAAREKNINARICTGAVFHLHSRQQPWMNLAGCFLFPTIWTEFKCKYNFPSIILKGWWSVHTFLMNISSNLTQCALSICEVNMEW